MKGKPIDMLRIPVWQKYLPANKKVEQNDGLRLSIAQTRRASHLLFSTLGKTPFLPVKCKKGKGRKKGDKLIKKTRYKPVRKIKKINHKTQKSAKHLICPLNQVSFIRCGLCRRGKLLSKV